MFALMELELISKRKYKSIIVKAVRYADTGNCAGSSLQHAKHLICICPGGGIGRRNGLRSHGEVTVA